MIDALLPVVLLATVATLAVAVGALRSSRRAEELGENRYELMRDQHERLEVLREERLGLIQELERESRERRQWMEALEMAGPQLAEELEQERERRIGAARRADQEEEERLRLEEELQRLAEEQERERQRLTEDVKRARGEHLETQRLVKQQEQELKRLKEELGSRRRVSDRQVEVSKGGRPWWRRPVLVTVFILGILALWLISLVIALSLQ